MTARLGSLRHAVALAGALALLGLAGCGDDEEPATETVTVTDATTETATGEEGPPAADLAVEELTFFRSADGNVGCAIDRERARCDIDERRWSPPPPPPDCGAEFGQGVELVAGGEADLVCAGDTSLGAGRRLPAGSSISSGLLRCESGASKVSCRDVESGRGFSIARTGYEIF